MVTYHTARPASRTNFVTMTGKSVSQSQPQAQTSQTDLSAADKAGRNFECVLPTLRIDPVESPEAEKADDDTTQKGSLGSCQSQ